MSSAADLCWPLLQSVDRAYRIGQKRDVIVYRLITCGTVEEKIYRRQVFKGGLFKSGTEEGSQQQYFTQVRAAPAAPDVQHIEVCVLTSIMARVFDQGQDPRCVASVFCIFELCALGQWTSPGAHSTFLCAAARGPLHSALMLSPTLD